MMFACFVCYFVPKVISYNFCLLTNILIIAKCIILYYNRWKQKLNELSGA